MVPPCVFYMVACDSGRVFFGSVSFARTKEMNSLRKSEKMVWGLSDNNKELKA